MSILVIRHAHAGERRAWTGDDRRRPLSEHGLAQADALTEKLAEHPLQRILSSGYDRCMQTVEPLAHDRGLEVEPHAALREGAEVEELDRLLRQCWHHHVALCSHGDVIGSLIDHLRGLDADLGHEPRWPKGSVWVLEGAPERPRVTYLAPPR